MVCDEISLSTGPIDLESASSVSASLKVSKVVFSTTLSLFFFAVLHGTDLVEERRPNLCTPNREKQTQGRDQPVRCLFGAC